MKDQWVLAQAGTATGSSSSGSARIQGEPIGNDVQTQTQAPGSPEAPGQAPGAEPPPAFSPLQLLLPVVMVVLIFMMFRAPKKQQKKHQQMVQSLEKNDRIRTIGGIIGTVMDVKDDEIVIKIDESNNTKIRVAPSAIGQNLTKETV